MSLTKKRFSLRKSRNVPKQPERNLYLERINNNIDDEMITQKQTERVKRNNALKKSISKLLAK